MMRFSPIIFKGKPMMMEDDIGQLVAFDDMLKQRVELCEVIQDLIDDPYSELTLRRAKEALKI